MASHTSGSIPPCYRLRETAGCGLLKGATLRLRRHDNIYASGDPGERVSLVERGRIKLAISSAAGKECLLGYVAAGELFGELSLAEHSERLQAETEKMPPHCLDKYHLIP